MNKDSIFNVENIRECEDYVLSIQFSLDKAVAMDDTKVIHRYFDLLCKRSEAVRILAVNRITRINQGKYTAGVDGIKTPRDSKEAMLFRKRLLSEIDIEKPPDLIKRVYIPKSKGNMRPLGIPTIADRVIQEIYRIALSPITEYHFHDNSYGFRPYRSCQDAQAHLFLKLSRNNCPKYVLEGDIKGCFDNINHNHILNTLSDWQVPEWAMLNISKILKSGIMEDDKIYDNVRGTPQGGVISPMLANVALTTLDFHCLQYNDYGNNPIVRYADDFVIVCKSEKQAKEIKEDITYHLKKVVSLELSDEKTKITHINKGFNFLGFNFRKHKPKGIRKYQNPNRVLLIMPEKEKVYELLYEIKKELKKSQNLSQEEVIDLLNPKLRGFGYYYRHVCSKKTYTKIDYHVWVKLLKWATRKHSGKNKQWVLNNLFHNFNNQTYHFRDDKSDKSIFSMKGIEINRFVKMKQNHRVYDNNDKVQSYWQKRITMNAYNVVSSKRRRSIFNRQNGKCAFCHKFITADEIVDNQIELDHIQPISKGGTNRLCNLRLVHADCHKEIHKGKEILS